MNLEPLAQRLMLPDPWQHLAVTHLRSGNDVIVSAPTGAGKTLVFEIFVRQRKSARQAVFTVPTRALANDKYAEWKEQGWNVGLATGDISENIRAPVLVATLETQIERLINNDGPELLVLDEFQMIADPSRGAHYEGAIVLAPPETKLLLLSGSVENPDDLADWMRRLGRQVEVVATTERPVPLEETAVEALPARTRGIEGWWPRLAAAVLQADLAPLLVFAPRRRDAESIAARLATHLPQGEPLPLTGEQRALAGREFAALLEKRIAYHHSGLAYAVRAGLVEPLAKAGQLRVIVSTMGLAAGINFSVRSVHVASTSFHDGITEQTLAPDELLQMFGRAGRRGLDERGYVITSRDSPTLADARPARLRRGSTLSWPFFLRIMRRAALDGRNPFDAARDFAARLFSKSPPELGIEESGGFAIGGTAAHTLFGLTPVTRELLNSAGTWEEVRSQETTMIPLAQAWLASGNRPGPALANPAYVQALAPGIGRLSKVMTADGATVHGKEIALGRIDPADGSLVPTRALRKLLRIPPQVASLTPQKIEQVALPRLTTHFPGARLAGLIDRDGLRWAQYDFSAREAPCLRDSLGRWITAPSLRAVERPSETSIRDDASASTRAARPGSPVHAWRSLGLIDVDGAPTRRGAIFSFFQHGEGLAIAAAIEDEGYPLDELALHCANLRSDCHVEFPQPVPSERLAAVCRATYGFVNHHGYLESGLPLGYGAGTAELIAHTGAPQADVSAGDLRRAYIEWLSLLRHVTHAPAFDWPRWTGLKEIAAQLLARHLDAAHDTLHPKLPPLTSKQRYDRPSHRFRAS